MNASTATNRIDGIRLVFQANGFLFLNALRDVPESVFVTRANDHVNHMSFIAAHVTNARARAAALLGAKTTFPWDEIAGGSSTSIAEGVQYPKRGEVESEWQRTTRLLMEALNGATDEALDAPVETGLPLPKKTVEMLISFLAMHESYHVGQLGLLRKQSGLGAMNLRP